MTSEPVPSAAPSLLIDTDGGVRTLTLNRPAAFNAFDLALKAAFLPALLAAAEDPSVRAVVITGTGRAFCAGQDLKEHLRLAQAGDPRIGSTVGEFYNPMIRAVMTMPKPVIAAINGVAAGAGAALAFACDLRIAAASASFAMAFAEAGLSADSGASFTLPRLIGWGRAQQMLLTGQSVDATEALRIGLVGQVRPDAEFDAAVSELARRLATGPTGSYAWIKASLTAARSDDLAAALDFEDGAQRACFSSVDHREALAAFVGKRRAHFIGS